MEYLRGFRVSAGEGLDVLLDDRQRYIGEEGGLCMAAVLHLGGGQCPRQALAPNPGLDLTLERPGVSGQVEIPASDQLPTLRDMLGDPLLNVGDAPLQGSIVVVGDEVEIAGPGGVDAALCTGGAAWVPRMLCSVGPGSRTVSQFVQRALQGNSVLPG